MTAADADTGVCTLMVARCRELADDEAAAASDSPTSLMTHGRGYAERLASETIDTIQI